MKATVFRIFCASILCGTLGCSADLAAESADYGTAKIRFLDVGQGLSVLFDFGSLGGNFNLYDFGNDSADFWNSLKNFGVGRLNWAFVGHWHRDHAGGLLEWDGSIPIDTIFYGPDTGGAWLRDSVLKLAKRYGTSAVKVFRGRKIECGEWSCQILWPPEYKRCGENNASAVLQISDGKSKALFPGDLEREGESELLEMSGDISADLLQVGHHGGKTSSSLRFLERVAPKMAVISAGKRNRYGHPAVSTLNKLELVVGDSASIFRTDILGNVAIEWKFGKGLWKGNF